MKMKKSNDEQTNREPWAWRAGMAAYRLGINAFFGAGGLSWLRRKYKVGIDERMGRFADVSPGGVWVHAVSVGEVQSASALIHRMKAETDRPVVLSTVTTTGRDMAERLLKGAVDHMVYSPWDVPRYVRSALDDIRPAAYVAMETERWPEMLSQLKTRSIPTFLANGRLSEASFAKLRREASFWRGVMSCFTRVLVRFDEDLEHFAALGVPREKIVVTGDCKVDALLDRLNDARENTWNSLRRTAATDGSSAAPLFVAGSTHQGEEEIVIAAFRILRRQHPDARLVIVPRHPERALMVVAAALPYPELQTELLSRLSGNWDVAVVDRIGILFDLYAAADAAFVGGSLVQKGGQNPLEPALFGILTAHGPCMTDFPDTNRMDKMGAARRVEGAQSLADAWLSALDPEVQGRVQQSCRAYFDTLGGAATRTWEVIREYLKQ